MSKVNRNTDFGTWIMQWIARVVSTLSIAFFLLMAAGGEDSPAEIKSQGGGYEG